MGGQPCPWDSDAPGQTGQTSKWETLLGNPDAVDFTCRSLGYSSDGLLVCMRNVSPTVSAMELTWPAMKLTWPAMKLTWPAMELTWPAMELTWPAMELARPAMELTWPAMELTRPAMELTWPAMELTRPAMELTWPDRSSSHRTGGTPVHERTGSSPHGGVPQLVPRSHGLKGSLSERSASERSTEVGTGVVTLPSPILVESLPDIRVTGDEAATVIRMDRGKTGAHPRPTATFPEIGVVAKVGDCPTTPVVEVMKVGMVAAPPAGMMHAPPRSDIAAPPCEVGAIEHERWGRTIKQNLGEDKPGGERSPRPVIDRGIEPAPLVPAIVVTVSIVGIGGETRHPEDVDPAEKREGETGRSHVNAKLCSGRS